MGILSNSVHTGLFVEDIEKNLTMQIGIGVPTKDDVDREYERLTALGVQSLTGEPVTQPWKQRNFWIADPEGNYIEIG